MLADEDYLAQCQAQGLYPVSYYPHNLHFLWAAADAGGPLRGGSWTRRGMVAAKVPHHHAGALAVDGRLPGDADGWPTSRFGTLAGRC